MTNASDRPAESVEPTLIESQAEKWFIRRGSGDISDAEIADHQLWLQADSKHRRAYEELEVLWDITGSFSNTPEITAARQTVLRNPVDDTVISRAERPGLFGALRTRWVHMAIAASFVMVTLGSLHLGYGTSSKATVVGDVYETRIGERKKFELSDGSVIFLDTQTRIIADFTPETRRINLVRGQARFNVAHDAYRPFSVMAGIGKITALGTAFVVKKTPSDVLVTLIEGKIAVEQQDQMTTITHAPSQPEHIGQQLAYSRKGISKANIVDIPQSVAWQDGRLVFENNTLAEVVSELNRYAKKKIVIGDRSLRSIRVTGVFNVGPGGNALRALQDYFSLQLTTDQRGNLVLTPSEDSTNPAVSNIQSKV